MRSSFEKLEAYGDQLPFPHTSRVIARAIRVAEERLNRLEHERRQRYGADPHT